MMAAPEARSAPVLEAKTDMPKFITFGRVKLIPERLTRFEGDERIRELRELGLKLERAPSQAILQEARRNPAFFDLLVMEAVQAAETKEWWLELGAYFAVDFIIAEDGSRTTVDLNEWSKFRDEPQKRGVEYNGAGPVYVYAVSDEGGTTAGYIRIKGDSTLETTGNGHHWVACIVPEPKPKLTWIGKVRRLASTQS